LTATPHSGKEQAFAALLALLDDRLVRLGDDAGGGEPFRPRAGRPLRPAPAHGHRRYLDEETFPTRETAEANL
jgi:hypothetical protein